MADGIEDNDLRRLEREAEEARARLHHTIAEIKDPRTLDNAKQEVMDRAGEMKDQIIGYITGAKEDMLQSGRSQTNDFTRKLQRTALENPIPVLLIGAGIGWHLYKKPPITTALIGAGVYGLMKNWDGAADERAWRDPYNAASPRGYVPGGVAGYGYDEVTDVATATERVKTVATNLVYGAQDAVGKAQDAVTSATDRVRDAVSTGVSQVKSAVNTQTQAMAETAESLSGEAADRVNQTTGRVQETAQDMKARVQDLASEAQRRAQPVLDRVTPLVKEHRNELGALLVLAGAGVFAGGLLRSTDTGQRWMSDAKDRMNDGYDAVRRNAQDMTRAMRQRDADDWRRRASQTAHRVADQAHELKDAALERAERLSRAAERKARDLRHRGAGPMRQAQDMGADHPILLSAIGLAIGAVLGGMIRPTDLERSTLGRAAGDLRDKAVDAVQDNLEKLGDAASRVAGAASEIVDEAKSELKSKVGASRIEA